MPVVDDEQHILGIVTVDDALEVLQEEHEEDLQIAGATNGANPDDRGGLIAQLFSSEMWVFLWAVGVAVCGLMSGVLTGDYASGLMASVALPFALRGGDAMARYVINSYLEYDEDDEDAPTLLGFALKGVLVATILAVVVLLLITGVESVLSATVLPAGADGAQLTGDAAVVAVLMNHLVYGARAAAVSLVMSFVTAPLYLLTVRRRDRVGKDTSGTMLRVVAQAISLALFVLAMALVCGWVW